MLGSPPEITTLLPLFPDDSKSVTMIRHATDVIKQAAGQLNSNQVPVINTRPTIIHYCKADTVKLARNSHKKSVCHDPMMTAIEIAGLRILGNWSKDSGWVEAIIQEK